MEKLRNNTVRKCIVSGELLPKEDMLRFVISPSGKVVPDLSLDLPGRGIWVKASQELVQIAVDKNTFSKAAKQKVDAPSDLAEKVATQLKEQSLSMLGIARKSGLIVAGFEKVKHALMKNDDYILFFAKDGTENAFNKIKSAAKGVKVINSFTAEEMGTVLGRQTTVHVIVKKGKIASRLCACANRFNTYVKNDEKT